MEWVGFRSAVRLAPSAFLASAAGAADLLTLILPLQILATSDPEVSNAVSAWQSLGGTNGPTGIEAHTQRTWDDCTCEVAATQLQTGADQHNMARLLASLAPNSGVWLNALPSAALGLNLDDNSLRVAVGLRLGLPLVMPHTCVCGATADKFGYHGLVCRRSAGRHLRHNVVNETILRAFQSASIPAVREPPGLSRTDSKRPDGATLVPWSRGRCLLWDATTPDTLAPSHLPKSAQSAGSAATTAEGIKIGKYAVAHEFVPVAIETLGAWGVKGLSFIAELGKRITAVNGDKRSTAFLKQRLALAVQRGNAAAVLGTIPPPNDSD